MKAASVVLFSLLFASCVSRDARVATELPYPDPQPAAVSATPLPPLELKPDPALESQISEIASQVQGRVGVSAVMLETGETAELNGNEQFPMQSVYKLPIAMAVLHRASQEPQVLSQQVAMKPGDFVRQGVRSPLRNLFPQGAQLSVRELLAQSISESDGTASDILLDLAGGPDGVMKYLQTLGIKDMTIADSEKVIFKDWETQYRNSSSPHAMVELLRALNAGAGIAPAERQSLIYLMENSLGRRRLPKFLPKDVAVAHKTGTGGMKDGVAAATNDAGIITLPNGKHILVCVYIADSTTGSREKVIADIGKAVYDRWSGEAAA